jgi:hypothetical protein
MLTKKCSYCNSNITRSIWQFVGEHQFCNMECRRKYYSKVPTPSSGRVATACEYCLVNITITPRQLLLNAVHFCNTDHKKLWLKEQHGIFTGHAFPVKDWRREVALPPLKRIPVFFQGDKYEVRTAS